MSARPETHGVLVTYRRAVALREHLAALAQQTAPLTTLTVIDNDADPMIKDLVEGDAGQAAARRVRYVPSPGNPGPAGGFRLGIEQVLAGPVDDDDIVVLLDDNDPPRVEQVLADSLGELRRLRATNKRIGAVGSWGATLHRRGRLRMAIEATPSRVDYLAGGACPHYLVSALRRVNGPEPDLFFGFEELDLGLALRRDGFELWSTGRAVEHGWGSMMERRRAGLGVSDPTWRRYYSVRNLITVLRKDGRTIDALFVSVVVGFLKPIANLPIRPRRAAATLRLTGPAVLDAWRSRLGRRVEPVVAG